jgi:formamidopyrimidine-DNA glycosylase
MPELPEVETVLRGLRRSVLNCRITGVDILHSAVIAGAPQSFSECIMGHTIAGFERRGKALALSLRGASGETAGYLLLRLGMTGQVVVADRNAPLAPHTHVRLLLNGGPKEIRYRDVRRFGRLRYCTREEMERVFDSLGPDALKMKELEFVRRLNGRKGAIKSWLLNQKYIAGLGNIYADEALYEARIHPSTPAGRVGIASGKKLFRAARRVLQRAVALQGTSFRDYIDIDGRPGNFLPRLKAYQKTGKPCPRCGAPIRRIVVGGRSSHFCTRCQRLKQ